MTRQTHPISCNYTIAPTEKGEAREMCRIPAGQQSLFLVIWASI
jgi:hypothetical protein